VVVPKGNYDQLQVKSNFRVKYLQFVEQGIDKEIVEFYSKKNLIPYLGSQSFRDWAYRQRDTDELAISKETLIMFRPGFDKIVEQVGGEFNVSKDSILISQQGRTQNNLPRWVAMYTAQQCGGMKLKDIAVSFGLKKTGSVSTTIKKLVKIAKRRCQLIAKC
jgi:hypothetical protein